MIKGWKRVLLCVGVIFVVVFRLAVFLVQREINQPRAVVLPAISMIYAKAMERENECYIVTRTDTEDGEAGGWYYMDGKERKTMNLWGHVPGRELSYIFSGAGRNYFLVRGTVNEEETAADNILTLDVKCWYLIAPIKRNYGPEDYREERRFFYPTNYLDDYDVKHGDYKPSWKEQSDES